MINSKSLLNISDLNKSDIDNIFQYSNALNTFNDNNLLKDKSIGLIFEKYSTRTRLSFQVGISQLGGNAIDVKFEDLNLQRVESFEDTFRIMSLYLDAIVFRTTDHDKLIKASNYFKKPIINGLSDLSHPCQVISDFYTLNQHFKSLDGLSISWFGDMNNVLFSYFEILQLYPSINLNVFTAKSIFNQTIDKFPKLNNINFYFDIDESVVKNSDCIMTDVFTSMNDQNSYKEDDLKKFQVNLNIMNMTKDHCIFMHCLPANIGSEVTNEVLNSPKAITLTQAKNRMIAQKGILKWLNI